MTTYNDTTVHYTLLYTHRIIYTTQPAYMYYNIQATRAGYGSQPSKYYNDYQTTRAHAVKSNYITSMQNKILNVQK